MFHLDQITSSESFQFFLVMIKNTVKNAINMDANRHTPSGFSILVMHIYIDI